VHSGSAFLDLSWLFPASAKELGHVFDSESLNRVLPDETRVGIGAGASQARPEEAFVRFPASYQSQFVNGTGIVKELLQELEEGRDASARKGHTRGKKLEEEEEGEEEERQSSSRAELFAATALECLRAEDHFVQVSLQAAELVSGTMELVRSKSREGSSWLGSGLWGWGWGGDSAGAPVDIGDALTAALFCSERWSREPLSAAALSSDPLRCSLYALSLQTQGCFFFPAQGDPRELEPEKGHLQECWSLQRRVASSDSVSSSWALQLEQEQRRGSKAAQLAASAQATLGLREAVLARAAAAMAAASASPAALAAPAPAPAGGSPSSLSRLEQLLLQYPSPFALDEATAAARAVLKKYGAGVGISIPQGPSSAGKLQPQSAAALLSSYCAGTVAASGSAVALSVSPHTWRVPFHLLDRHCFSLMEGAQSAAARGALCKDKTEQALRGSTEEKRLPCCSCGSGSLFSLHDSERLAIAANRNAVTAAAFCRGSKGIAQEALQLLSKLDARSSKKEKEDAGLAEAMPKLKKMQGKLAATAAQLLHSSSSAGAARRRREEGREEEEGEEEQREEGRGEAPLSRAQPSLQDLLQINSRSDSRAYIKVAALRSESLRSESSSSVLGSPGLLAWAGAHLGSARGLGWWQQQQQQREKQKQEGSGPPPTLPFPVSVLVTCAEEAAVNNPSLALAPAGAWSDNSKAGGRGQALLSEGRAIALGKHGQTLGEAENGLLRVPAALLQARRLLAGEQRACAAAWAHSLPQGTLSLLPSEGPEDAEPWVKRANEAIAAAGGLQGKDGRAAFPAQAGDGRKGASARAAATEAIADAVARGPPQIWRPQLKSVLQQILAHVELEEREQQRRMGATERSA